MIARRLGFFAALLLSLTAGAQTLEYEVSLAAPASHLVGVKLQLPPGAAERVLQLPVWNALYQIRDFSQYLAALAAEDPVGHSLPVIQLDKSSWKVSGAIDGATIHYQIRGDDPGPYGAQLNATHAFLNLAEVLVYPVEGRALPIEISFANVPQEWKFATSLKLLSPVKFSAQNYDQLVDSPIEAGMFRESDFDESGAHYRIVVDADPSDYVFAQVSEMCRRIVGAEVSLMQDRPFDHYLFIYHFPRGSGGGGMEHAFSTAIDLNARYLKENPTLVANITAHEFFHLWNVKRIRPRGLEPVDYTKENYTDALWFSEGVSSTIADYALLQIHVLDEAQYLERLGQSITELESRPAHLTQSAEESSLDAWLEKYPAYRIPRRSISYYNKGELLGIMLDLKLRDLTHDSASLRTLFQYLNKEYAQRGRFFDDSEGIRLAAEAVANANLRQFFADYVAGTREIPWDEFLAGVGLRVERKANTLADVGFTISRNVGEPPVVSDVAADSAAELAGLASGDAILELNGKIAFSDIQQELAAKTPGDPITLKINNRRGDRELHWTVGTREQISYEVKDGATVTAEQRSRRDSWLHSDWFKPALIQSSAARAVGENPR